MSVHAPTRPAARDSPHVLLTVACLALLPPLMNYTTPLVSMVETSVGLQADDIEQTWIMNATPLGLAASLLAAGTVADNFGRRRMLILGSAAHGMASLIAGMSMSPGILIAARVAQGVAAATIVAASLGMIGAEFTQPQARARATGLWAASLSAALAIGPLLTGGLTGAVSWRGVYWLYAALGLVLAVVATSLAESRAPRRHRLHATGIVSLVAAMSAGIAALTLARQGWHQWPIPVLLAGAITAVAVFVTSSRRHSSPVIDTALWRHRPFLMSIAGSGLNGFLMIGVLSSLCVAWQFAHDVSSWTVAALWSLYPLTSLVASRLSGHLPWRPPALLAVGYLMSLSQLTFLGTTSTWNGWQIAMGFVLAGCGGGLANAANARMAVDSVPRDAASLGSGAANTARYVGSALGVATVLSVVGSYGWGGLDFAIVGSAALLALGASTMLILNRRLLGGCSVTSGTNVWPHSTVWVAFAPTSTAKGPRP